MKQTEMNDLWIKADNDYIMPQRLEQVIKFVPFLVPPYLDMGEPNPFSYALSKRLNIEIKDTGYVNLDLDDITNLGNYGTVFSFEVIEHLANPLFHLVQMKKLIEAYNGTIYLSYPSMPQFLWNYNHYNEIQKKRFLWLVEAAGLKVIRHWKKPLFGRWYTYLYGIRPFIRLFYCRSWNLYMLKINDEYKKHF